MLPRIGGVRMAIQLLAGITILLFLLFGRGWLRGIEGNVEWQDREGGNDYFTVAALVLSRL
jgi:hypothetical protein